MRNEKKSKEFNRWKYFADFVCHFFLFVFVAVAVFDSVCLSKFDLTFRFCSFHWLKRLSFFNWRGEWWTKKCILNLNMFLKYVISSDVYMHVSGAWAYVMILENWVSEDWKTDIGWGICELWGLHEEDKILMCPAGPLKACFEPYQLHRVVNRFHFLSTSFPSPYRLRWPFSWSRRRQKINVFNFFVVEMNPTLCVHP